MPAIRVLLAEPDEIIATILTRCLDGGDTVVSRVAAIDQAELSAQIEACKSDVLLAGPSYPHARLLLLIPRALARGTRTLVLSNKPLDDHSSRLLLAGASGFLPVDQTSMDELREAVRTVASGDSALHPAVVQAVLQRWRALQTDGTQLAGNGSALLHLTSRERQVLHGLREGLTSRQLATRLRVAEKTIEAHKSRLYAKLGARNQAHAVRIAEDRGIE